MKLWQLEQPYWAERRPCQGSGGFTGLCYRLQHGLQGLAASCKLSQGVAMSCKELQGVARSCKELQG
eukprot:13915501-Alexandrium_andersonii.AAC.1